ncbi:T9SS type A sorting domain-containing protein [Mucilaginibacter sp.]
MSQVVKKPKSRNPCFLLKIFFSGLIFILLNVNASAVVYDWLGATSSDVTVASNWSNETTFAGGVPGSGDDVNIGVNSTYKYISGTTKTGTINLTTMPVVTANTTWKSLTFGYYAPATSYIDGSNSSGVATHGMMYNLSLMVNSGITLTVSGNVTQNHNPSVRATSYNYLTTIIGGTGTLLCKGNFLVGDATTKPDYTVADVTKVALQITQLTITGNIILNSNGNNASGGNAGICYPLFSVEKGTTTLQGQITFATNNSPLLSGYNTYNPGQPGYLGQSAYQGYGEIEADNTAGIPNTFELQNKQPIVKTDNFYVFFEGGGNSGTVLYDDPNTETQTVYTANEPSVTTTATYINIVSPSYYNLTLSGPSPKSVDGNSTLGTVTQGLVVGNNWTTSGGVVNLTINNPTITIGGGWANSTTVTQGTGSITTGGFVTNSSIITGSTATITVGGLFTNTNTFTCGTGSVTYKGGYTNSANFTATTTGMIYFNGTQTLLDNSTPGTTFYNVTFNSPSSTATTATMTAGVGNFTLADIGVLTMVSPAQLVAGSTTVGGAAYLTLKSDGTGTASIAPISGTSTLSGNVTAERYIPGGSAAYRSYRLLTLPVNISSLTNNQASTEGFIDLSSFNSGIITAGPGTGFSYLTKTANPLMYLYDESRAQNFSAYVAGKNVGIYSLATSSPYQDIYYPAGASAAPAPTATAAVPVGNSVQVYYVGPYVSSPTLSATAPAAATTSATGYLNQGTIPVYIFPSTSSKTLSYSPAVNTLPAQGLGLNQVGNPYASTIDLDSVYFDNKSGTTAIGPSFWELKQPSNIFVAYNAASHTASTTGSGATAYLASGQGFFVQAISTASALTFYEQEKVNVPIGTSTTPVLILSQRSNNYMPAAEVIPSGLVGLHLQMTKDSVNYVQTGIYFNSSWSDKYSPQEDAIDMGGLSPEVYLSSYSTDNVRLSINQLGNYSKGKIVKLYTSAISSGSYAISLADINNIDAIYNVYLRDHKLNDSVDMRTKSSYSFTINTSDTTTYGGNRFDLVIALKNLPAYQLLTFTGQKVKSGVQLNWVANNAGTYTGFILEKQGSDSTFYPIYTVQSNGGNNYNFVDGKPIVGNNTYRLAQSDINGNITYSSLITIGYNNTTPNGYFSVYPNPSKGIINVLVNSATVTNANYTADIYNTAGVLMDHRVLDTYSWTEDISSYKEGVYIISLKNTNGESIEIGKFIKVK